MLDFRKLIKENFTNEKTEIYDFNLESLVFEERVKLKCFQCKNYGVKHTCPPKMITFDYEKIFKEYLNALVLRVKFKFADRVEFELVRTESTNYLHKTLLKIEKLFWENNESMATSFIGGSCKLCKDGCDDTKCRNPNLARIPWEATGVNIIKTLKNSLGIEVDFTNNDTLYRYGIILW